MGRIGGIQQQVLCVVIYVLANDQLVPAEGHRGVSQVALRSDRLRRATGRVDEQDHLRQLRVAAHGDDAVAGRGPLDRLQVIAGRVEDPARVAAVGSGDPDARLSGRPAEHEGAAVRGKQGPVVLVAAGDQGSCHAGRRIHVQEIATLVDEHAAVIGRAEGRRRRALPGTDVHGEGGRDCEDEEGSQGDPLPGHLANRSGSGDDAHGDPPFEGAPARPLPRAGGLAEHVVEVVGDAGRRELGHELGQVVLEAVERGHATCPPATGCRPGC